MINTDDAYGFPPFREMAPSIVIGEDDYAELRRKEKIILTSAMRNVRVRGHRLQRLLLGRPDRRAVGCRAPRRAPLTAVNLGDGEGQPGGGMRTPASPEADSDRHRASPAGRHARPATTATEPPAVLCSAGSRPAGGSRRCRWPRCSALAAFLRFWQLDAVGFNSDEAVYTGTAASIAGNPAMLPIFPIFRAHPVLFQMLLSLFLGERGQ